MNFKLYIVITVCYNWCIFSPHIGIAGVPSECIYSYSWFTFRVYIYTVIPGVPSDCIIYSYTWCIFATVRLHGVKVSLARDNRGLFLIKDWWWPVQTPKYTCHDVYSPNPTFSFSPDFANLTYQGVSYIKQEEEPHCKLGHIATCRHFLLCNQSETSTPHCQGHHTSTLGTPHCQGTPYFQGSPCFQGSPNFQGSPHFQGSLWLCAWVLKG